jgi:hypothetical protein
VEEIGCNKFGETTLDFRKDQETLEECIKRAMSQPEINSVVSKAGLSQSFLESKITDQQDVFWEVLSSDLAEYDRHLEHRRQERTTGWQIDSQVSRATTALVFLVIFSVLLVAVKILFFFQIPLVPAFLQNALETTWGNYLSWALVVFGAFGIIWYFLRRRRMTRERNEHATMVSKEGLDAKIESASRRLWERAATHALPPLIREIANQVIEPSRAITLRNPNSDGLSEVFLSRYEISTLAKKELESKVAHMPGGSIGLAGPRGVGKTTLMKAYCEAEGVQINSREVTSIMLSAPVEYDAREFIIHLFVKFCRRILEQQGKLSALSHDAAGPFEREENATARLTGLIRVAAPLALVLGVILIAASFAIAYLKVLTSREAVDGAPSIALGPFLETLSAVGLNPATYMNAGIFMVILAYIPAIRSLLFRQKGLYRSKLASTEQREGADDFVEGWYKKLIFQQRFTSGWSGTLSLPMGLAGSRKGDTTLARNPLNLPEIVDGFREVVDFTTQEGLQTHRVSGQTTLPITVIIGIDELDKVHKIEHVTQFLNDIKALFHLENCFFLVSISEDAMSNFEMRGVPVRDVFDSSFDDVVYLKYLTRDDSARLLHRRVVGLPLPFLDFLYCFSGGLPRDLIRNCRGLLEAAPTDREEKIDQICAHLLSDDVGSKLRILQGVLVTEIDQQRDSELITAIEDLESLLTIEEENATQLSRALNAVADDLLSYSCQSTQIDSDDEDAKNIAAVEQQHMSEFSAYFAFVATLYDVFVIGVSEEKFESYANLGIFEKLALAKQKLSDNPYHCIRLLQQIDGELEKHAA